MKKLLIAVTLASLTGTVTAQDGGSLYAEAAYSAIQIEAGSTSAKPSVSMLRLGYNIDEHFSLELMAAASVGDDSIPDRNITEEINDGFGAYLKGKFELVKDLEFFGRIGATRAELTVTHGPNSYSGDAKGFSYGAGLQYHFTDLFYGQIDYMSYCDKDGISLKGSSISIGARF